MTCRGPSQPQQFHGSVNLIAPTTVCSLHIALSHQNFIHNEVTWRKGKRWPLSSSQLLEAGTSSTFLYSDKKCIFPTWCHVILGTGPAMVRTAYLMWAHRMSTWAFVAEMHSLAFWSHGKSRFLALPVVKPVWSLVIAFVVWLELNNTKKDSLSAVNYFENELGFSQVLMKPEGHGSWAIPEETRKLYKQFKSCIILLAKPDRYCPLYSLFTLEFSIHSTNSILNTALVF